MFSKIDRVRRTVGFRLALWHAVISIVSTLLLFALAYLLLSSSVEKKDSEEIHEKLVEYATQYGTGGIEALVKEVASEKRSGNIFFVRVAGPDNSTRFVDDPDRWSDF